MELSVVIPTYNGKKLLENSLHKQFSNLGEVIIIDNASTDDTKEYITSHHNTVTYIPLDKNYGFTKGVNIGIRAASNDLILILNNDCVIDENNLKKLLEFMSKNTQLCATQPIVYKQNSDEIENIGYIVDLKKGKAEIITAKKNELNYEPNKKNNDIFRIGHVYGLSATCLLIRREILEKVGMFDESFHSYLEDVDLFIRLAKKGYRYAPCLNAIVQHKHMATSSKMKGYKEWHDLTNWVRIIKKNYPASFIFRNLFSLCIERLRNLKGYLSVIAS